MARGSQSREARIAKLSTRGDSVDRRTAELMQKDAGLSSARAQQKAFRQLVDERYQREGNA